MYMGRKQCKRDNATVYTTKWMNEGGGRANRDGDYAWERHITGIFMFQGQNGPAIPMCGERVKR